MKEAANLVSIMFMSREQAHRAHLAATGPGSYASHVALGDFYEAIIPLADRFAEAYAGMYTPLTNIPYGTPAKGKIDAVLESFLTEIVSARSAFEKPAHGPLLNIIDEIAALYLGTLYKLRNLE